LISICSGVQIPADLQKLWDDYKEEQEMLGKKVKSSSGFSGKGFKFDEAEAQLANEKKKKVEDDELNLGANLGQRFEEELEINDFPQQARWKVTSKEALAQISEYSEAGITVRGTYYPQGKEPKETGERKLYLAIEGTNELSVSKARAEIIRLIKEELIKMVCDSLIFN